ncbi:DUF4410 domain-containing protein [Desulfosarcina sp.]|uniref:DUF4410 domain-containing protein n=1 Tax=Desulfosarcina sp. TaxID=2027861 RepID=UPI00397050C7
MNRTMLFSLLLSFSILVGCAGTGMKIQNGYTPDPNASIKYSVDPKVKMSQEALGIFKERLESQFRASGLPVTGSSAARSVEIVITNYYMRHGAARALVGIMAGVDNIQSSIIVRDMTSNAVLGQFSVKSSNPTAIFTSRGLIEDHADKIVRYVSSGHE